MSNNPKQSRASRKADSEPIEMLISGEITPEQYVEVSKQQLDRLIKETPPRQHRAAPVLPAT